MKWRTFLTHASVVLTLMVTADEPPEERQEEDEDEETNDYLYDSDDALPVQEYHAKNREELTVGPNFIYGPGNGARVVEFYAPWCPHCQHFRDHYIDFASQVQAVTEEIGAPSVEFFAISCTAYRPICRDFNISGYPRLYAIPEGGGKEEATEVFYWELHPFTLLNTLGIQVDEMRLDMAVAEGTKRVSRKSGTTNTYKQFTRTKQQVFNDARLSFDFSLRHGVFMTDGALSNKTKLVLQDWLELLKRSLPPAWKIHTAINAVLDDFDRATKSEENLIEILDGLPSFQPKQWSKSCTKGATGMGYTCGLWELFHIMTVGVVEWNMMLGEEQIDMVISPEGASRILRNFIEHFFGCEVCRMNFLASYDNCAMDRCNRLQSDELDLEHWWQLPVWLYDTHNGVNLRLAKEAAEREGRASTDLDEVESQWPSREECSKCHHEAGTRDESIYQFLRVQYWPEDFIADEYRQALFDEASSEPEDDEESTGYYAGAVIIVAVAGVLGWLWTKRLQIARSGRHKKVDL